MGVQPRSPMWVKEIQLREISELSHTLTRTCGRESEMSIEHRNFVMRHAQINWEFRCVHLVIVNGLGKDLTKAGVHKKKKNATTWNKWKKKIKQAYVHFLISLLCFSNWKLLQIKYLVSSCEQQPRSHCI